MAGCGQRGPESDEKRYAVAESCQRARACPRRSGALVRRRRPITPRPPRSCEPCTPASLRTRSITACRYERTAPATGPHFASPTPLARPSYCPAPIRHRHEPESARRTTARWLLSHEHGFLTPCRRHLGHLPPQPYHDYHGTTQSSAHSGRQVSTSACPASASPHMPVLPPSIYYFEQQPRCYDVHVQPAPAPSAYFAIPRISPESFVLLLPCSWLPF